MSIPEAAVEAAAKAHFENGWGDSRQWEDAEPEARSEARSDMRAALEAAAPHTLAPVLALHPKTCEQIGGCCELENCPTMICGPCGETWPCPTVAALQ